MKTYTGFLNNIPDSPAPVVNADEQVKETGPILTEDLVTKEVDEARRGVLDSVISLVKRNHDKITKDALDIRKGIESGGHPPDMAETLHVLKLVAQADAYADMLEVLRSIPISKNHKDIVVNRKGHGAPKPSESDNYGEANLKYNKRNGAIRYDLSQTVKFIKKQLLGVLGDKYTVDIPATLLDKDVVFTFKGNDKIMSMIMPLDDDKDEVGDDVILKSLKMPKALIFPTIVAKDFSEAIRKLAAWLRDNKLEIDRNFDIPITEDAAGINQRNDNIRDEFSDSSKDVEKTLSDILGPGYSVETGMVKIGGSPVILISSGKDQNKVTVSMQLTLRDTEDHEQSDIIWKITSRPSTIHLPSIRSATLGDSLKKIFVLIKNNKEVIDAATATARAMG